MESVRGRSRIGTNHAALVRGGGWVGSGSRSKWPEGVLPTWRVWGWSSASFLFPSLSPPRPAPLSPYRAVIPRLASCRAPSSFCIPFHPPCWRCSGSPKPSPGFLTPLVMTIIEYIQTPNQRPPGVWLFPPGPPGGPSPTSLTLPGYTGRSTPFAELTGSPPSGKLPHLSVEPLPSSTTVPRCLSSRGRLLHHPSNNSRALFSNTSAWSGKC